MNSLLLALVVAVAALAVVEACGSQSGGGSSPPPPPGRRKRDADSAIIQVSTNLEYSSATLEANLKVLHQQLKEVAASNGVSANGLGADERHVNQDGFISVVYTVPNAGEKCAQLAVLTEKAVKQVTVVHYGSLTCGGRVYEFEH